MWWNHGGWGPMYGWWLMPFVGIICMVVFFYLIHHLFGSEWGCCRPKRGERQATIDDLKQEIQDLREEIKTI